jgi:hypothetical protein
MVAIAGSSDGQKGKVPCDRSKVLPIVAYEKTFYYRELEVQ